MVEMRLGRRRRLGAQPSRGPQRRCSPRRFPGGDGDGVDRISGLNDDLLIQVLVRLRCAAAAACTSILSRRWHGLWRHLPELSFRRISPDALQAAIAQVAVSKLFLLDIEITDRLPAEDVASLLRTAAHLDPVDLSIVAWAEPSDELIAIEVPSFARATSIRLHLYNIHLSPLAQGGEFPALERLSIADCLDIGALLARCPHLRVLELISLDLLIDTVTVHSATIEELLVSSERLRGIDIVAPMLNKFTLRSSVSVDFSLSLLAQMVENLSWECWSSYVFDHPNEIGIDGIGMWYLSRLKLRTEKNSFVLGLVLETRYYVVTHRRNLQEMFQLPNISVLELCVKVRGHVYEAMVLDLLRICNAIKKLKLVIHQYWWTDETCPPDCPCNQSQNWRSQNISLTSLEVVEIEDFKGRGHEVDFLKLLFRCAPLRIVTLKLASEVVPSSRGCKETFKIFKANPAAECHVYRKHGKEVIYA